jgi:hypothetical protein
MARNRTLIAALVFASGAWSQTRSLAVLKDEETIRGAVVFITEKGKTDSAWGAGIVMDFDLKTLPGGAQVRVDYIITAKHVLTDLGNVPIGVRYYKDPTEYDAAIDRPGPSENDPDDIALLRVDTPLSAPHSGGFPNGVCLPLVDYDVYMVGHPNKRLWEVSGKPAAVTAVPPGVVQFQSPVIASGNSGGALVANNLRCLVGMVIHDDPPQASAISVQAIASKLKAWHIPHAIQIPRNNDLVGLK